MIFICPQCGVELDIRPSYVARMRYCSMRCRSLATQRGIRPKAHFTQEERAQRSLDKLGAKNPMWKGAEAKPASGRERARRRYNLDVCEDCGGNAHDRHHVDGNPLNNEPSNIAILCRRCHMRRDGRLRSPSPTPCT
jgi:hypothetical protein